MKIGIYAGTFDPPTNGHLWVIEHGAQLFDRLIVAVGINPEKQTLFRVHERETMLKEVVADFDNITVVSFINQYLVRYADAAGATHILRGIRNSDDFEYERAMRHLNGDIVPGITSVYLIPPRTIAEVSSSVVKGLVGPEGWQDVIANYVPATVVRQLERKTA